MAIYIIRADYGRLTNQFKELGIAAICWLNKHEKLPKTLEEIEALYEEEFPTHK